MVLSGWLAGVLLVVLVWWVGGGGGWSILVGWFVVVGCGLCFFLRGWSLRVCGLCCCWVVVGDESAARSRPVLPGCGLVVLGFVTVVDVFVGGF